MDQTNAAASPFASCRSFTLERRVRFLSALAGHGHVRKACGEVGVSPQAAYMLRRRDPHFAAGWDAAMVLGREQAAQIIGARALDGTREQVWYRGKVVGERVRFDTRLQLAWLARLDSRADDPAAARLAAGFDDYLFDMLDGARDPIDLRLSELEAMDSAEEDLEAVFPDSLADLNADLVAGILADPANDPDEMDEEEIVEQAWELTLAVARAEASDLWRQEHAERLARLDAVLAGDAPDGAQDDDLGPDEGKDDNRDGDGKNAACAGSEARPVLLATPFAQLPPPAPWRAAQGGVSGNAKGPDNEKWGRIAPLEFKSAMAPHAVCQLRQLGGAAAVLPVTCVQ